MARSGIHAPAVGTENGAARSGAKLDAMCATPDSLLPPPAAAPSDDRDTAAASGVPLHRIEIKTARGTFVATDSPCVAVCSTLYDDICRGCGRTAMEVANWVFMNEAEKHEVWVRIRAQGYPRRNNP